jgi:phage FluMu protein Com
LENKVTYWDFKCNKLLAISNSNGKIEGNIKCVRCGTINER